MPCESKGALQNSAAAAGVGAPVEAEGRGHQRGAHEEQAAKRWYNGVDDKCAEPSIKRSQ